TFRAPVIAVVAVYLQISGFGPMLGSGFWLIASERFDPRTAKQRFGQIAGVGTLGGLLGGLLAERIAATVGVEAMLPVLAVLNFLCAWHIRRLATGSASVKLPTVEVSTDLEAQAAPSAPPGPRTSPIPQASRRNRAPWSNRGGSGRIPAQVAGRCHVRTGRDAPPLLRHLLRGDEPDHFRRSDLIQQIRPGEVRIERYHGHAVGRTVPRWARRAPRSGPGCRHCGQSRRVGVSKLAFPRWLRALLHTSPSNRKACGQVDYRRGVR